MQVKDLFNKTFEEVLTDYCMIYSPECDMYYGIAKTEDAIKMITNNFHSGEIMLLHPNSKTNSEVLDKIIKEAKNQGYEFKLLDQFK